MSLSTKYESQEVEDKWYQYWMEQRFFHATPQSGKEPYSIVIPPPNVTGVLHMGHMLNNTIQDVLIRKARMDGKEACWVPGTDHASIATEAKVVAMLREKGIKKSDLTREEFLAHAMEWKDKYGGIILEQLKKLGASCDWDRTTFTMDDNYYKAVIRVFVDLYKKGYIYRGLRIINWDCEAKTALSNEEVVYNEDGDKANLYSVRYAIKGMSGEYVTIATVRPETIMGDAAIAVNPSDERYQHLIGKHAIVPFVGREIPIIADNYVDKEFGTGCLKVTPAHDPNDYEIGQRHNLEIIDTINDDGTLNEKCGVPEFVGRDRFIVRKMAVKRLEAEGNLVKVEEFLTRIGRSERTNTVVEPKLSLQWFIKMKDISEKALNAVVTDEVQLHPAKFKSTYTHWMENVRDWCISRQLWWGQQIPAYFYGTGEDDFVVAESAEEALALAQEKSGNKNLTASELTQDEDVLDTWASSWLFPIEVFHGFADASFESAAGKINKDKNADLAYFYPTKVLVTAPEILFFWVARMIIAGYEYLGEKPFEDVYLTGIVRDKQRRKMSKSLGNSPDPLDLIKQYGADGVRTGMLFSSPAGNDLLFDEKLVEQGRNFANKIWNAFRLVKGWEVKAGGNTDNKIAVEWYESRFNESLAEIEDNFAKFRISDALMVTYKLVWDDFCSSYLEMIKPTFGEPIDAETLESTIAFFERILKVLHPFMPFITEELWHELAEREARDCIIVSEWPKKAPFDAAIIDKVKLALEVVAAIRNLRNEKDISPKEKLPLVMSLKAKADLESLSSIIVKLSNLESLTFENAAPDNSSSFVVRTVECHAVLAGKIDVEKEKADIIKEITYQQGFQKSITQKLSNAKFVDNAPAAVVEMERKKLADAEAKIKSLEENLAKLV